MLRRIAPLLGLAGLLAGIVPMAGFALFLAGIGLPRTVDAGPEAPWSQALLVDLGLLLSFAVVHSGLARSSFKERLGRFVPAGLERSFYCLVAGVQIALLLRFWLAIPGLVWSASSTASRSLLWAGQAAGWLLVLAALAAIGPGHLFGSRQAAAWAAGRPYRSSLITTRGPYRWLRHPLYAGTAAALLSAPDMSRGRLLMAVVLGAYMLLGVRFEERDLERRIGEPWRAYRRAVPAWPRLARLAVSDPIRDPRP